jgi:type VI secretion system Hcp family effector
VAATLIYLNIDFVDGKVSGESSAKDYENRIEIESFSWEMEADHRELSDKRQANTTVRPRMVKLEKFFDASSTALIKNMKDSKAFKTARISFADMVLQDGRAPKQIMRMILKDGHVEDVRLSTGSAGKAMSVKETISLSFRKLELHYHPQDLKNDTRAAPMGKFMTDQPCAKNL